LEACWQLSRDHRFTVVYALFEAGLPISPEVHEMLNKAVTEEDPEERLIELLIRRGASPAHNSCKTLVDATRTVSGPIVMLLLEGDISPENASLVFTQSLTKDNVKAWFSEAGYRVAKQLLLKGASGAGPSAALAFVIGVCTPDTIILGDRFVELLLEYNADVDYNRGQALRVAASRANIMLVRRLLGKKPAAESLSLALNHVFDRPLSEAEALELIALFTDYADGENRLDVMISDTDSAPVLFLALSQHPRSVAIVRTLLDAGYYYDQVTICKILPDMEEEAATLLLWALLQPQKKISSGVIELLIETGGLYYL
jgi:hypothetical protein